MKSKKLLEQIGNIDEAYIEEAAPALRDAPRPRWIRWAAAVACLCLFLGTALVLPRLRDARQPVSVPGDLPPNFTENGIRYFVSSYNTAVKELPEGFSPAGEVDINGTVSCPAYRNPDIPEWVYVCQNTAADTASYVRYVDERLRGKDLILRDGTYYISMWSANNWHTSPDVSPELYDSVLEAYGVRLEGDPPEGFAPVGTAEFTGHDTIPRGTLASNQSACQVYADPAQPDILLIPASWYTHTREEAAETLHTGFDVYLRWEGPISAQ